LDVHLKRFRLFAAPSGACLIAAAIFCGACHGTIQKTSVQRAAGVSDSSDAMAPGNLVRPFPETDYDPDNANRVVFDSAYKQVQARGGDTYEVSIVIRYKHFRCVLTSTFLNDTSSDDQAALLTPPCLDQQWTLYEDGHPLTVVQHPGGRITVDVPLHPNTRILSDVVMSIGFIKSGTGAIYVVAAGVGSCLTCKEFTGLYTPDGQTLLSDFRSGDEDVTDKGSVKAILKKAQINEEEFSGDSYSKVSAY
jgi:hypothetical protein